MEKPKLQNNAYCHDGVEVVVQKSTLFSPFKPIICPASSGVAGSMLIYRAILTVLSTCSALLLEGRTKNPG